MRILWVLAVVSVLGVSACSSATNVCTPASCEGCCSEAGECLGGLEAASCGFGGAACRACALAQVCTAGLCVTPSGTGGGGGGSGEDGGPGDDAGTGGGGGGAPTQGACAGTLIACGTTCVDGLADPSNCGGCGRVCGQGQVCNRGTCATLPTDCTMATGGCGPGLSCDPVSRQCTAGCRLVTDCPQGATCTAGQCACPMGQHPCGQQCVPDDVVGSCGASCSACVTPTGGTVTCESGACVTACPMGQGNDAGVCVDTDECAVANGGCSPDAVCTNTAGSRTCACKSGFTGDGITCTDINECATNNGGCHVSATCLNSPGSYACACNTGFAGDGGVCTDVNECLTANGGCASVATCANTDGGRTCTCPTGYTGGVGTCTDINECNTNNGGCNANATCTNTPGSRTCACNPGYTGNGFACTAQPTGESCAVAEVIAPLTVGGGRLMAGTTVGFTNDVVSSCTGNATFGRDYVYSYALGPGRRLRVNATTTGTDWDHVAYFVAAPASTCAFSATPCLDSSDVGGAGTGEQLDYTNTGSTTRTVFLVIDSKSINVSGTFSLNLRLD
jgi:hypothetical protein